jgi:hypothetical protein
MKKVTILSIFAIFIIYSIVSLFVEIPKVFNNIFYGIITIFSVYFSIFHLNLSQGIKEKFNENRNKYEEKTAKK